MKIAIGADHGGFPLKEELADSPIMLELSAWSFGVDLDEEAQRVMDTKLRARWPEAFE